MNLIYSFLKSLISVICSLGEPFQSMYSRKIVQGRAPYDQPLIDIALLYSLSVDF